MAPARQAIVQPLTPSRSRLEQSQRPLPLSPLAPFHRQRGRHRRTQLVPLVETGVRVGLNGLLLLLGGASLAHLLPYIYNQAQSLASMQVALDRAETSHLKLQADLNRYFDPTQLQQLIQEQSGYQNANERPVVWINPAGR